MTLLLSDDPDVLAVYGASGSRRAAVDLPPGARRLWRLLGPPAEAWVGEASPASGFWRTVVVVREASESQFDVLARAVGPELLAEGPVAALALSGRSFHGQRGRPWAALEGNLHVSAALAPRRPVPALGLGLTMLPAVAVVDAVRAATGGRLVPELKWVNDVIVEGRKVAGVLTATQVQGETVEVATLGIGVNVQQTPRLQATPFVPAAGSLCASTGGSGLALPRLFWLLLDALAARCETLLRSGPVSLFDAYVARSLVVGRAVRIWEDGLDDTAPPSAWPALLARGVVHEMAPDLTLLVGDPPKRVARGRLAFEDACRAYGL